MERQRGGYILRGITLGFFTELLGAAFTLFIIDTLLVRSKTKRWQIVRVHVDYLIARNINRLRDGIAMRAFGFEPEIASGLTEVQQLAAVREQRAGLLTAMEALTPAQLMTHLADATLFTPDTHDFVNEKAEDLWGILNMKYSEYMDPDLVSALMRLHTHLKNTCGHIRQHERAARFPDDAEYYRQVGRMGAGVSIQQVVAIVNDLKQRGYSEAASLTGRVDTDPRVA